VSSVPNNTPRRILVVDDEPALRETISLTLELGHVFKIRK
jgi:CheY-like chemotaxis protein